MIHRACSLFFFNNTVIKNLILKLLNILIDYIIILKFVRFFCNIYGVHCGDTSDNTLFYTINNLDNNFSENVGVSKLKLVVFELYL